VQPSTTSRWPSSGTKTRGVASAREEGVTTLCWSPPATRNPVPVNDGHHHQAWPAMVDAHETLPVSHTVDSELGRTPTRKPLLAGEQWGHVSPQQRHPTPHTWYRPCQLRAHAPWKRSLHEPEPGLSREERNTFNQIGRCLPSLVNAQPRGVGRRQGWSAEEPPARDGTTSCETRDDVGGVGRVEGACRICDHGMHV
jgi:hypothetical protein